jgi:hypothetical protein
MDLPHNEFERIAEHYARMSDGELEQVAADGGQLTESARSALRREMEKRQLESVPEDITTDQNVEPDLQNWIPVKRFRDLPEAMLAKGSLESSGIECHLVDENMVRLDWFISNLLGGVKLMVKTEDLDAAQEIMNHPIPHRIEYGEESEFEQPMCPKCGSLDISYEEFSKGVRLASLYVASIPLPVSTNELKCNACGARWPDETLESP